MAKSLILYQSSHGNTEKILKDMVEQAKTDVDLAPLKKFNASKLDEYERIAFGGSIHAGRIQKNVKAFAEKHAGALKAKPLALFVGCLDRENYGTYIETSFPEDLTAHAELKTSIGGDVVMEKLPGIMRMMMKKITPNEKDRHFDAVEGREALRKFLEG